jgi:hypothetical protein
VKATSLCAEKRSRRWRWRKIAERLFQDETMLRDIVAPPARHRCVIVLADEASSKKPGAKAGL